VSRCLWSSRKFPASWWFLGTPAVDVRGWSSGSRASGADQEKRPFFFFCFFPGSCPKDFNPFSSPIFAFDQPPRIVLFPSPSALRTNRRVPARPALFFFVFFSFFPSLRSSSILFCLGTKTSARERLSFSQVPRASLHRQVSTKLRSSQSSRSPPLPVTQ